MLQVEMHSCRTIKRFSASLLVLLVGCGENKEAGTTGGNACDSKADLSNVGSLVAIATQTYSPDLTMRTDTIQFADNLTASGKVDPARTIELSVINSTLWPSANPGEMFLADAATGNVIKYVVAADGSIEEKNRLGFGAYGVTSFHWALVAQASPTKVYLFDEITLQGFVWNPECMTITSQVNLADRFNPNEGDKTYTVWRERQPLEVGGKFFSTFQYVDPSTATILPRSGMLVIDSVNDTFTVVENPSCAGLNNSVLGSDGRIYSASSIFAAGTHYLEAAGTSCLARFDPKTMQWDASYHPDIATLTGGAKFAGALFKNKSNRNAPVYMRVLQDSAVPAQVKDPYTLSAVSLWRTFVIDDLANPTKITDTGIEPAGGLLYPIEIDDKTYVSDASLLMGKSWLVDLSVDPPARTLEVAGWGFYAVKLH